MDGVDRPKLNRCKAKLMMIVLVIHARAIRLMIKNLYLTKVRAGLCTFFKNRRLSSLANHLGIRGCLSDFPLSPEKLVQPFPIGLGQGYTINIYSLNIYSLTEHHQFPSHRPRLCWICRVQKYKTLA